MDKKDLILESIIDEYLKFLEPISSKHIMNSISIKISSASIRNYFNKLSQEGALNQLHVSGGRVPTASALAKYWLQRLDLDDINFNSIDTLSSRAKDSDIFYVVKYTYSNILKELINIDNRFLVLVFEENEMVMKYNGIYEKLLKEFILSDINELVSISKDLGALELSNILYEFMSSKNISYSNISILAKIYNNDYIEYITKAKIFDDIGYGVYFNDIVKDGYMGIKAKVSIDSKDANLLCIGKLNQDFEYFLAS